MELIAGDIIRLILFQTFLTQRMLNVFHFRVSSAMTGIYDLEDITEAWFTLYADIWAAGQYVAAVQTGVKAINLSQTDNPFFEFTYSKAGINGGTALPSNVSASFKQTVSTNKTKAGGKRYGGLTTAQVSGNTLTSAGLSSLEPVRQFLFAGMIVENDAGSGNTILFPVILKNYITEFPTANDYQNVTGCVLNPTVGSQNSRKSGYGD